MILPEDSKKRKGYLILAFFYIQLSSSSPLKLADTASEEDEPLTGTPPSIISDNKACFFEEKAGTFEVAVTGAPSPSVTCTGDLPFGVSFNPSRKLFSGTPSFGTRGNYPLQLTARNGITPDAIQAFTLKVLFSGSLDKTFGLGGKVTTTIGTSSQALAIALQTDGKIVVAGVAVSGSAVDFALVRYNPDESLDNTFRSGGKLTAAIGTSDEAMGMAIQSDGKILLAGTERKVRARLSPWPGTGSDR